MCTLINRESKRAATKQFFGAGFASAHRFCNALCIKTCIGTYRLRRAEIHDQHIDRTVRLRLEDKLAFKLQ
ncbi:hypothetical protein D3C87_1791210 [compost metagenome]